MFKWLKNLFKKKEITYTDTDIRLFILSDVITPKKKTKQKRDKKGRFV